MQQSYNTNPYEEKKMVDEYMAFHYCPPDQYVSYKFGPIDADDFTKRCAELCLKHKSVRYYDYHNNNYVVLKGRTSQGPTRIH